MRQLGLEVPLIVAPMAGGPSSPALVAESSNAGALGSVGAAYFPPKALRAFVTEVRARTSRSFAINLFVPAAPLSVGFQQIQRAQEALAPYHREFGLADVAPAPPYAEDFGEQFEEVLRLKPAVFSFIFGRLDEIFLRAAKQRGILVIGTATTPEEARALEAAGVDAIVLQGTEAGGHRGTFDASAPEPGLGTLELLRVSDVRVPRIAAGGLMTSTDIRGALSAGAAAVQLGTAFLACAEAGTSRPYRRALDRLPRETHLTRAFSGRLARGLRNRFSRALDALGPDAILPFPAQNQLTRALRQACADSGSDECLSLWAGQGEGELFKGTCCELIERLFAKS